MPEPGRIPIAVFISGSGTNMAALLYASRLPDCPYRIALVASNNPDAGGLTLAQAEGVATFVLPHKGMKRAEHDAAMESAVLAAGARFIALAGYMRILGEQFVTRWQGRMINIHPSLLPKYTGLDTHARAIAAGVKLHGCTVHLVTQQMDDGPILAQAAVPVLDGDTEDTLADRVLAQEHVIYPAALQAFISGRVAGNAATTAALLNPLPL